MSELDGIVDIVITRDTTSIASANFSTPMLVSKTALSDVAVFKSAKAVKDAGYAVDTVEYLASVAHFSIENHPPEFKIAEWDSADTISEAMDKIVELDNQFFGVALAGSITALESSADYASLAIWADQNGKMVFGADADVDALTTLLAMNAGIAQNASCMVNSYLRSAGTGIDSWQATMGYADISFMSKILGMRIGSYTAINKTLKGARVDKLTSTQIQAIEEANGCYYVSIYNQDLTQGGRVTDGNALGTGEWLDVEIGIDWTEVRMQEAVFKAIIVVDKIPYTDKGTASIQDAVIGVLELGVKYGIFASFTTSREPVSEQTSEDKANRFYGGISWNAVLAGAIHTTTIYGNVEV